MAASYPTSVKSFGAVNDGDTISDEMFEEAYDEITAMQQAMLTTGLAHHLTFVDATYDIGQSGATRPRHAYLSGTVTVGGGQIVFPASQAASSNANTLDDYEEGTFVVVDGSGAGLSLVTAVGNYVKIGQKVDATMDVTYPATADTSTATLNLPFTSNGTGVNAYGASIGYTDYGSAITAYNAAGTNAVRFATFAGVAITNANMSGKTVRLTATYRASA